MIHDKCIALELTEEQSEFIASDIYSLAEAYAITNSGINKPMTYGIYNDGTMVGFIMVVYQPSDENDPDDSEFQHYILGFVRIASCF